ncbi:chloride channel protein [Streptacidiphilus jiangxiensis]|uniref:H+/Cl-antiporter ClcA n=1 Tax=Streptacidiphilus jiangxiensis TaxID=235985 RepID=A0A1H7Q1T1_STRJI|nr:chloride channel protein [Streptacidiphilus jiangxiensis]SEL41923.1 H+/Cl-antiporter ClcA [Streptacidiphilus jiangxiensis]
MASHQASSEPAPPTPTPSEAPGALGLKAVLLSPGYLKLLVLAVVIGVPVSLVAFGFVGLEHQLQHWVWTSAPQQLGYDQPPWWWPLPTLALAGLLIAPVLTRMTGHGGHLPVRGLGGPPVPPKALPSVVLAALIALPLGVSLGPEAPLMALGAGLALLAVAQAKRDAQPSVAGIVGTAGSTAAIATIFGNPLVGCVMVLEAAGLGGPQLLLLVVPCLLASGIGAVVFTGFGHWTGLGIGALTLPSLPTSGVPEATEFLWSVPVAALVAVVVVGAQSLGWSTALFTRRRTGLRVILCAVAVGVCIAAYGLFTGRSPEEAALSGQATLGQLAADPHAWGVGALVLLVLFKGLAWGISLGSLRGGPIFPAILIGAAIGIACSGLPGLGTASGLSIGLAASGAAITGLPVTASLLAILLVGANAADAAPLMIVSAVVSFVVATKLRRTAPDLD